MPQLKEEYVMSQEQVAEELSLCKNTIMNVERRALEKLRKLMEERGISAEDILED